MLQSQTILDVSKLVQSKKFLTREIALEIFEYIKATPSNKVDLDFTNIDFISRSFADQFHKEKLSFHEKFLTEIRVVNQNEEVFNMFSIVANTQNKVDRAVSQIIVVHFKERKTVKEFLYSI